MGTPEDAMNIVDRLLADQRIDSAFRIGLAAATGRTLPKPTQGSTPARHFVKVYSGRLDHNGAAVVRVTKDGDSRALRLRLDISNHSPTGFMWGYAGSGPAQLALAILADALGDDQAALRLHQRFKFRVICALKRDSPWLLSEKEVLAAVKEIITKNGEQPC
jgi:Family of unknown function (DUF6166)